jgi:hypothetical protein
VILTRSQPKTTMNHQFSQSPYIKTLALTGLVLPHLESLWLTPNSHYSRWLLPTSRHRRQTRLPVSPHTPHYPNRWYLPDRRYPLRRYQYSVCQWDRKQSTNNRKQAQPLFP